MKISAPESLFWIKLQAETFNFIKNKTVAQVLCCEFCEFFKNTIFYRAPLDDCFCILNLQVMKSQEL